MSIFINTAKDKPLPTRHWSRAAAGSSGPPGDVVATTSSVKSPNRRFHTSILPIGPGNLLYLIQSSSQYNASFPSLWSLRDILLLVVLNVFYLFNVSQGRKTQPKIYHLSGLFQAYKASGMTASRMRRVFSLERRGRKRFSIGRIITL